jgi:3-oxoacyl-[acyl-carrier-protein] synthase-3
LGELGYCIRHSEETNTACTSFVTALLNSYRNFAVDGIQRAVVVGSDTLSMITDYSDRSTGILFGDGAGAVVMEQDAQSDSGLLGWSQSTNGELEDILYCEPGGYFQMDGPAVFKHAVSAVVSSSRDALQHAGTDPEEIKLMIPHQANVRIMEAASRRLGIGMDRFAVTIDRHGNTSSASIPMALTDVLRRSTLSAETNYCSSVSVPA